LAARFVERVSRPGSDFAEGNTNPRTGFVAGSPQPSPLGSPGTERVNRLLNRARAVRRGFGGPFRQVRGSPSGTLAGAPPHPPRDSHRTQDTSDACDQSRRGAAAFGRGGLLTDGVLRACGGQACTPCERRDRTRRRSTRCQGPVRPAQTHHASVDRRECGPARALGRWTGTVRLPRGVACRNRRPGTGSPAQRRRYIESARDSAASAWRFVAPARHQGAFTAHGMMDVHAERCS
jgi:hypothetical protein